MWSLAFFHAPDDTAARSTPSAPDRTDDDELSTALSELEHFLTGRHTGARDPH